VNAVWVRDRCDSRALAAAQVQGVLVAAVFRKPVDRVLEVNLDRTSASEDANARAVVRNSSCTFIVHFEPTQPNGP